MVVIGCMDAIRAGTDPVAEFPQAVPALPRM
jgi:hypothetical protein